MANMKIFFANMEKSVYICKIIFQENNNINILKTNIYKIIYYGKSCN